MALITFVAAMAPTSWVVNNQYLTISPLVTDIPHVPNPRVGRAAAAADNAIGAAAAPAAAPVNGHSADEDLEAHMLPHGSS